MREPGRLYGGRAEYVGEFEVGVDHVVQVAARYVERVGIGGGRVAVHILGICHGRVFPDEIDLQQKGPGVGLAGKPEI